MKLYDVCDDLSLSLSGELKAPAGYKWTKLVIWLNGRAIKVELGYCNKHKELHYLRTNEDVNLENERL